MRRCWLLLLLAGCGSAAETADRTLLSSMGLYANLAHGEVAPEADEITPRFQLWTDGAAKRRWMRLPEGEPAFDISAGDRYSFPIGTRFYKELAMNGVRIETRVISYDAPGEWFMGAYVWREDQSDAELTEDGMTDARGSGHDVPSRDACMMCHRSEESRILGFTPVQIRDLPFSAEIAAAPAVAEGLGYLHANCGHCHNPNGFAAAFNDMTLKLALDGDALDASHVLESTLGKQAGNGLHRIAPGQPELSALIDRMTRDDATRMPPLGARFRHDEGVEIVRRMIEALEIDE